MKSRKSGFTLVELLTVLVIIALMMGILLPALNMVRNTAKEAKQKVQFATIEQAIMAFKGDCGDYPPSKSDRYINDVYDGAQQLAEALVGWDLMGFDTDSAWRSNGYDATSTYPIYPQPLDLTNPVVKKNLEDRKGPYLELSKANVFRLGISAAGKEDGLFDNTGALAPNTHVICDSFGIRKLIFQNGPNTEIITAGTPILYYKANTSSKGWFGENQYFKRIYNYDDNFDLIGLGKVTTDGKPGKPHWYSVPNDPLYTGMYGRFYNHLTDPKFPPSVITGEWPVNADSYVLISAGADGEYGTADDITNF